MVFPDIDHLVFVTPDLEAGMGRIERLLDVRPVVGGRHPDFGTRNALLSLGGSTYLEVIAPDPDLKPPDQGRLTDVWGEPAGLFTWVARREALDSLARSSVESIGDANPCSRVKPDGTVLRWTLTDPFVGRQGGPVPFLIDWGSSPHPSESAPHAGELVSLRLSHPDPTRIEGILASIGIAVSVDQARRPSVRARIRTPAGELVELS